MKRIGIYSGRIPSTPFVEHLIGGLVATGKFQIELYGVQTKAVQYSGLICIKSIPSSYSKRVFFVGWHFLILLLTKSKKAIQIMRYFSKHYQDFHTLMHDASLALIILRNPPDVFHIQWAKSIVNLSWLIDLQVCKTMMSLRGAHINYTPLIEPAVGHAYKQYFPRINGFHAVSHNIANTASNYGTDAAKTKVLYSIVPDSIFTSYTNAGADNKILRILSVGRFHWIKGYGYALDAMALLKKKNIKFQYTLIAQGPTEEIMYQIHDQGLQEEVKIMNALPHQEVMEQMQHHDMLLLPSLKEGVANVVLEAMAIGLPVVSTNCGGMDEIIKHGINGWLVSVRNPQAMADAIEDFIHTAASERMVIREAAHHTVKEMCNEKRQIEKFNQFYQQVIDAKD